MDSGCHSDPCSGKRKFGFGRRRFDLRSAVAGHDLIRKAGQVAIEQMSRFSGRNMATNGCSLFVDYESEIFDSISYLKMTLSKPENKHVSKAFDLRGKVAAVTGMLIWL